MKHTMTIRAYSDEVITYDALPDRKTSQRDDMVGLRITSPDLSVTRFEEQIADLATETIASLHKGG